VNYPAAELRGIKHVKRQVNITPHPIPLPNGERGRVRGYIATAEKSKLLFFACGDVIFILTAELSGIQQQLFINFKIQMSNTNKPSFTGHCTPRVLPQDDYVILQGTSSRRARQSQFLKRKEIASSVYNLLAMT
jgi:hypothetical protein